MEMDILAALDVLQRAPREILKDHAPITILTLQRVGHLLDISLTGESEILTSSTCRCRRISSENEIPAPEISLSIENRLFSIPNGDLPRPRRNFKSRCKSPEQNRPRNLWEAILEKISLIWQLSDNQPGHIIAHKRATQRDKRIYDIIRFEKAKTKPTIEDQLLRGVAQRSLALEYSTHQATMKGTRRVDEICCALWNPQSNKKSSLRTGRGGTLRLWAREYLAFATDDENIVCGSISAGIKQLVIEESLQRKFSQSGFHIKCSGISAVTALAIQEFKGLRLEDIPPLVELITATLTNGHTQSPSEFSRQLTTTSSLHIIPSNNVPDFPADVPWVPTFLEVVRKISTWFDRFQLIYDRTIFSDEAPGETLPKQKRVCLTPIFTDCSLSDASESPLSATSLGYARSPPTSPQYNDELSVDSDSSSFELPFCANVTPSNDQSPIGSSGHPRNNMEFDIRVSNATINSSQAEQGLFLFPSPSNDLTGHYEVTQQSESTQAQSISNATSIRGNHAKRKRNHVEQNGIRNEADPSPRTRLDTTGFSGEHDGTSTDENLRMEPTGTTFHEGMVGESQISTNNMSGAYWPDLTGEESLRDTNSTEWLQPSIDMNDAALPGSAPGLPLTVSTISNPTNVPTSDVHNELYALFDHQYTSPALPTASLWSLFFSETQPQYSSLPSLYPM